MDISIIDIAYILTVGAPPLNMLPQQKVNHVVDKVISIFSTTSNTNNEKDIPINLIGELNLNLDIQEIEISDSSGNYDFNDSYDVAHTDTDVLNSNDSIELNRDLNRDILDNNVTIIDDEVNINESLDHTIKNSLLKKDRVLNDVKQNHKNMLVRFFSERNNVIQLTDECRNLKKQLYETGEIQTLQLLTSNGDGLMDLTDEFQEVKSILNSSLNAKIRINKNVIYIISSDGGFKINDTLFSKKGINYNFFRVDEIKNINISNQTNPITWNIPLHTQIYRYFYPDSFDIEKINNLRNNLSKKSIETVLEDMIEEYYSNVMSRI